MIEKIEEIQPAVYVILGIDAYENDKVLAVSYTFEEAKRWLIKFTAETEYFDLWIEKHALL